MFFSRPILLTLWNCTVVPSHYFHHCWCPSLLNLSLNDVSLQFPANTSSLLLWEDLPPAKTKAQQLLQTSFTFLRVLTSNQSYFQIMGEWGHFCYPPPQLKYTRPCSCENVITYECCLSFDRFALSSFGQNVSPEEPVCNIYLRSDSISQQNILTSMYKYWSRKNFYYVEQKSI